MICLVFSLSTGTITSFGEIKANDWIEFAFTTCYPNSEMIYDNQRDKNGLSVDHRVEPENFTPVCRT